MPARVAICATAISVLAVGTAAASVAKAASSMAHSAGMSPYSYSVTGVMGQVVTISETDAWAVGEVWAAGNPADAKAMTFHWNGKHWSQVSVPQLPNSVLKAIAVSSANSLWAVGYWQTNVAEQVPLPLLLHWDGRSWHRVTQVPLRGDIFDVSAAGGNVWAVGATMGKESKPFALHLVGGKWYVVAATLPGFSGLVNVVTTGPDKAWAVARDKHGYDLLRWTGSNWIQSALPVSHTGFFITAMARAHSGNVWVIGGKSDGPLSMLWTGKAWRVEAVPSSVYSFQISVGAIPGGTAWGLGWQYGKTPTSPLKLTILHWSGREWMAAHILPDSYIPASISASSPSNAWITGYVVTSSGDDRTLTVHWNGKTWSLSLPSLSCDNQADNVSS